MVLRQTSTWSCIITLVATTLGATIVAVPNKFANSGLALSSGLLLLMVIAADASLLCLVRAGDYVRNLKNKNADGTSSRKYDRPGMQECTSAVLGRVWEILLQFALVLLLFFAASLFLCILSGSMVKILSWCGAKFPVMDPDTNLPKYKMDPHTNLPVMDPDTNKPVIEYQDTIWWVTLACAAFCYPLTTLKNLDALKYSSLFSNLCIGYMFVIVCVYAVERLINKDEYRKMAIQEKIFKENGSEEEEINSAIEIIAQIFGCVACFSTSFCNQFNILELKYDLEVGVDDGVEEADEKKKKEIERVNRNPAYSKKSIDTVIHTSLAICFVVNLIFGFAGYVLAGGMDGYPVPDLITTSPRFDKEVPLMIATVLVALSNLLRYPLIVVPLRSVYRALIADIKSMMNSKNQNQENSKKDQKSQAAQPLLESPKSKSPINVNGTPTTVSSEDDLNYLLNDVKETKFFAGLGLRDRVACKSSRKQSVASGDIDSKSLSEEKPLLPNLLKGPEHEDMYQANQDLVVKGEKVNAENIEDENNNENKDEDKVTEVVEKTSFGVYFEMAVVNALLALSVIILKTPGPVLDVLAWNGIPIICFIVPGALYGGVHSEVVKNKFSFLTQFFKSSTNNTSYGADTDVALVAGDENVVTIEVQKKNEDSEKNATSLENKVLPQGLKMKFRRALMSGKVMGYVLSAFGVFVAASVFLCLYVLPHLTKKEPVTPKDEARVGALEN